MHHLLLGIDPIELGGAPFALAVDSAVELPASDIGLLLIGARVYVCHALPGMLVQMPRQWFWQKPPNQTR